MQDERTDARGGREPPTATRPERLATAPASTEAATAVSVEATRSAAGPESAASRAAADQRSTPALSIAGAARGLGVATATLRSWERRYGLAPSLHTPGGHRRYASEDLARLQVMHRLVRAGVPAAEAARVAIATEISGSPDGSGPFAALLWGDRSEPAPSQSLSDLADDVTVRTTAPSAAAAATPGGPIAGGGLIEAPVSGAPTASPAPLDVGPDPSSAFPPAIEPIETASPTAASSPPDDELAAARGAHGSAGGGRVLPLPRWAGPNARGLARSAMALDSVSCERILVTSLTEHGTVPTWDDLIRPVMAAIGRRWQSAQTGVDVEHSFSMVVAAGLAGQAVLHTRVRNDSPVLLASVPDELHDLPLRALHAALAEQGIRAHLLGARTPADALAHAVRRLGPPVVVLWAQMPLTELPVLPVLRPAPALIVGGPGLRSAVGSRVQAHSLTEAVGQVRAALGL